MTESDEASRHRESRHVFWTLAFLGLVALTVAAASIADRTHPDAHAAPGAFPAGFPPISGMALLERDRLDTYVVVHDTKAPDAKDPAKPRVALLQVIPGTSPRYQPLALHDDGLEGGPLSDIEAIASIPMRPFELLLLESGGGKHPRRLAHVEITRGVDRVAKVLGYVDVAPLTPSLVDCEGLLCWRHGDQIRVLIADRGETTGPALRAQTFTGVLTLPSNGAALSVAPLPPSESGPAETVQVEVATSEKWRTCSDLFLDSQSRVWSACAHDPGDDGPFSTRVYLAGILADGRIRFSPGAIAYTLDGLKVEALGPCSVGKATLCVATDDESYGGAWRPLPPPIPSKR